MFMGRGKRYENEPKLNLKKVFGVALAFIIIILLITSIVKILKKDNTADVQQKVGYFTIYDNGKWGVIDSKGEIVIQPIFAEYIAIPNNQKDIFVCTYDINDSTGEYKTKLLNSQNQELYTQYELIEAIDNYDSKNNIWFEDNVLKVKSNGKFGMIDFEGKSLLQCQYDNITALKGVTGMLLIEKDGKVGLVNSVGQIIVDPNYTEIKILSEDYQKEYIIVDETGKYGLVSTSGTIIIEPVYDDIKYIDNSEMYAVKEGSEWSIINNLNNKVTTKSFDEIEHIKGENIIAKDGEKYGIFAKDGTQKIEPQYDELKFAFSIYYIAKKDGKFGIINLNNEAIIPFEYESINYLSSGGIIIADKSATETVIFDNNLAQKLSGIISEINVDNGYMKIHENGKTKYYNFKFEEKQNIDLLTTNTLLLSEKDGKFGYVDKQGNIVVEHKYDDAKEQNAYGYAAVKKDGVWGSINANGQEILSPSINLDSTIYTDFIGAWHLDDTGLYFVK